MAAHVGASPLRCLALASPCCRPPVARAGWAFKPLIQPARPKGRRACKQRRADASASADGGSAAASGGAAAADAAEERVRAAALLVANTFLRDEITIGVGTGLGVNLFLEEIAARLNAGKLRGVKCVPASDVAASEAAYHGVPLTTLQAAPKLDLFIEVADEMSSAPEGNLAFIIGRRQKPAQPQLHRARELAAAAVTTVAIVEDTGCLVPRLGGSLPVAVEDAEWEECGEELDDLFLGDAELWRRSLVEGSNPRGGDSPYVSAEGHAIVDIRFYEGLKLLGEDADYGSIAREIDGIPGVVAHGLCANVAAAAVVAGPAGAWLTWRGDAVAPGGGAGSGGGGDASSSSSS